MTRSGVCVCGCSGAALFSCLCDENPTTHELCSGCASVWPMLDGCLRTHSKIMAVLQTWQKARVALRLFGKGLQLLLMRSKSGSVEIQ